MAAVPVQMDVEEEEKGAQKSEIDELKKKIKDLEAKAEEKETAWSKADEEAREMPDDDPKRADCRKRADQLFTMWEAAQRKVERAEERLKFLEGRTVPQGQQGK